MSVTMKDVAARAKVSVSAVSQALRNKGALSPETRRRIIAIAEEMGYTPPEYEKQMRIAVVCCEKSLANSEIYTGFYEGAKNALGETLCMVAAAPSPDAFPINSIVSGSDAIDGLIFFGGEVDHPVLQAVLKQDVKCVVINRESTDRRISTVSFTNYNAFYEAASHLLTHGYRDFAYIYAEPMATWSKLRLQGCQAAVAKAGGTLRTVGISDPEKLSAELKKELQPILKEVRAILAENDVIGLELIQYLQEMQLRIPEDIAVFGCDNLSMGAKCRPGLSTIKVPAYGMGEIAGELVKALVTGEIDHGSLTVPGKLILRKSCGCP